MGMHEDDRIRSKNAAILVKTRNKEVICDSCGTVFYHEEVKGEVDKPCPKCDKKTLYIPR